MAELTLGSLNLHLGRGTGGHGAPLYDAVAAAKEVGTDVLALQESWAPDGGRSQHDELAEALDHTVAATFTVARATRDDRVTLMGRDGTAGDGDWVIALLTSLPVRSAEVVALPPQLPRDPGKRAVLRVVVDVDGVPFTVVATHLPLLKDPVWRLRPALRAALPPASQPAAFVGDMNMWGWTAAALAGRGWRRAVRGRTYPAHRPHSQTDHILVTPPVEVLGAEVMPQVMSDHRPVRAHLRLR